MLANLISSFFKKEDSDVDEGLPNLKPDNEMTERWNTEDPIVKTDILDFSDEGFLLHKTLSQEECEYYISGSERLGYEGLEQHGYRKDYRNSYRVMIKSQELADLLWNRIKGYVTDIHIGDDPSEVHVAGYGMDLKGKWEPIGVNEVFRICKYNAGGHFSPHYDAFYAASPDVRSMKTLMLYLNGDFEGGTTNFIKDTQKHHKNEKGIYCAEEENILYEVEPEAGMAIIFNHHRLHEGGALKSGVKYILRSDVMYKKVTESNSQDPTRVKALEMLKQADILEGNGSSMEAMELYKKAYKLCPELENCN